MAGIVHAALFLARAILVASCDVILARPSSYLDSLTYRSRITSRCSFIAPRVSLPAEDRRVPMLRNVTLLLLSRINSTLQFFLIVYSKLLPNVPTAFLLEHSPLSRNSSRDHATLVFVEHRFSSQSVKCFAHFVRSRPSVFKVFPKLPTGVIQLRAAIFACDCGYT